MFGSRKRRDIASVFAALVTREIKCYNQLVLSRLPWLFGKRPLQKNHPPTPGAFLLCVSGLNPATYMSQDIFHIIRIRGLRWLVFAGGRRGLDSYMEPIWEWYPYMELTYPTWGWFQKIIDSKVQKLVVDMLVSQEGVRNVAFLIMETENGGPSNIGWWFSTSMTMGERPSKKVIHICGEKGLKPSSRVPL